MMAQDFEVSVYFNSEWGKVAPRLRVMCRFWGSTNFSGSHCRQKHIGYYSTETEAYAVADIVDNLQKTGKIDVSMLPSHVRNIVADVLFEMERGQS